MVIKTKFLAATNFKGSRVKATATISGRSITVPWDYAFDVTANHLSAVGALKDKLDLTVELVCGEDNTGLFCVPKNGMEV